MRKNWLQYNVNKEEIRRNMDEKLHNPFYWTGLSDTRLKKLEDAIDNGDEVWVFNSP